MFWNDSKTQGQYIAGIMMRYHLLDNFTTQSSLNCDILALIISVYWKYSSTCTNPIQGNHVCQVIIVKYYNYCNSWYIFTIMYDVWIINLLQSKVVINLEGLPNWVSKVMLLGFKMGCGSCNTTCVLKGAIFCKFTVIVADENT